MSCHGGAEGEAAGNLEANPFWVIIGTDDPGRGDIRKVSFVGDALSDVCPLILWPSGLSFTPLKGIMTKTHLWSPERLVLGWGSVPIWRNPACTRKSHTRLVLLTSTLTRSLASRRRSLPPLRAYSRTSVSLMTRYGFGNIRSCEHSVCSAGVRRWSDGLLARFRGAAGFRMTEAFEPEGLGLLSLSWLFLDSNSLMYELARLGSGPDELRPPAARNWDSRSDE